MKDQHDILIFSGTDFSLTFTLTDEEGNIRSLEGKTIRSQLRESPHSTDFIDFTCTHTGASGEITITLTHEQTSDISFSKGVYDIIINNEEPILYGHAMIIPASTKIDDGTGMFLVSFNTFDDFPLIGSSHRIYLASDTNLMYRFDKEGIYIPIMEWQGPKGDPGTTDYNDLSNKPTLGDMAAEDDAPSDNKKYGRKNGNWVEIQEGGGTGNAEWGDITGDLTDQEDLIDALNEKAPIIYNHASGSIASFPDGSAAPVTALSVSIEPVQDLHGYDNPWPAGGGKNLAKPLSGTTNGITFTSNADGTIQVSGTFNTDSWTYVRSNKITISESVFSVGDRITIGTSSCQIGIEFFDSNNARVGVLIKRYGYDQITIPDNSVTWNYLFYANTENTVAGIAGTSINQAVKFWVSKDFNEWTPYSNICPISGHTSATVTRTGKNLFDPSNGTIGKWISATGEESTNLSGYISSYFKIASNTKYTINENDIAGGYTMMLCWYDESYNFIRRDIGYISSINGSPTLPLTVTSPQNAKYARVGISIGSGSITEEWIVARKPQVELSSTATAYEAPQVQQVTIDLDGTRYGGNLDVLTGLLTVTDDYIPSYNGETLPSTWISDRDVYAPGTTPTTGAQVVYKLATPLTVQLTPSQISTLLGTNHIWADTGDVAVEYRADTKLFIQEHSKAKRPFYVKGTQTSSTGSWTGNLPDIDALYEGLIIDYWLPYAGSGNATLNLTLGNGQTTGAINCYYQSTARLTTHIPANNVCQLVYQTVTINGTSYTGWWLLRAYDANTTYSVASTTANGLMSKEDKTKLNGIAENANAYTLPTASASELGGVKVGNNLSISDGVLSATDTTYSPATSSANGLMSSTDKSKLDGIANNANNYSLPNASSNTLGGVKVGSNLSIDANGVLSATDTTYRNASSSTAGLMSSSDKSKLDGIASGANAYVLPAASSSALGGVKIEISTTDLEDGVSQLEAGKLYFYIESQS